MYVKIPFDTLQMVIYSDLATMILLGLIMIQSNAVATKKGCVLWINMIYMVIL